MSSRSATSLLDHAARARRVVGGVAVDQHVDVGVDVGEHAPHHAALALVLLAADDGAGPGRRLDGAVGGIVVVDVDAGLRQRRAEIGHDLADGRLLVVARHQHRDPAAAHDSGGVRIPFSWQHWDVSRRPIIPVRLAPIVTFTARALAGCIIAFLSSCVPLRRNPETALGRRHPIQSGRRHHRPPGRARHARHGAGQRRDPVAHRAPR